MESDTKNPSFTEYTFFWDTATLPDNASFDDEKHESW